MKTFLRLPEVKRMTGLGHSTIYNLMNSGDFPRSFRLSPGAVAWDSDEIAEWLLSRERYRAGKRADRLSSLSAEIAF